MTVRRRRYGRSGFGYTADDGHGGEEFVKFPGVTKILAMMPRDALINWAAEATADYAINNWHDLETVPWADRLKRLYGARYQISNPAAHRGTEVHKYAEPAIEGETINMDEVPQELRGYVEAYLGFCDTIEPAPLEGGTELVVASRTHRYCGTADLVADLPDVICDRELIPAGRWLLELKTTGKGIYPESALQACAYSRADVFVHPDNPEDERPMDWLKIEHCGAVWIKSDDWELRPLDTGPEVWETFLQLRRLYDLDDSGGLRAWVSSPATVR
jgi:hypothetical protein